ncbi:MAG: tyrosine-type recombinase/integrase [bacterium]|nr:tyrosine-type recombinase/integrase [bacterium]
MNHLSQYQQGINGEGLMTEMSNVVRLPVRRQVRRVPLTEQRVADLKPASATTYWNDQRMACLSVRVTPAGAKSYVFTRKVRGRLVRITLGKAGGMTLSAARKAVEALNGDLARGVDIAAARRSREAADTLDDAFERFMATKDRRPRTQDDYAMLWRLHVPSSLKRKSVADVTQVDVEKLHAAIGKRARRTANKVVVLIAAIMARSGRWADNPTRGVERFEERVRTRRLSADELARLWKVLNARHGALWADFFMVMILTGARRGALCAMRWQDLDLDAGVWAVPVDWSKNKREIAVALTGTAATVLRARPRSGPWVWPSSRSASGHVTNPEKPWKAFLAEAGLQHATLHDVRRTLGSNLAKSGAAAATITKALGHVSAQSARAYVHLDTAVARKAIDKALEGITGDGT